MTATFGDLGGYFFGNFRDKASNILWHYATPCRPVIDCKMNDFERLFHVRIRFQPALLDSECLTFKNNCVKSNKRRPRTYCVVIDGVFSRVMCLLLQDSVLGLLLFILYVAELADLAAQHKTALHAFACSATNETTNCTFTVNLMMCSQLHPTW